MTKTHLRRSALGLACGLALIGIGASTPSAPPPQSKDEFAPQAPVPYLTPEEEAKTFRLPAGYHMQLVLSDPQIKEPVACVFDGNGRMYVPEMRSYMQDIDGTNELTNVGRVSRHESTKGDGVFDKHTVFADHLLLPREVLPLKDRVLIGQTNTNDIYAYFDTKNTGVADKKEMFYPGGPRGGNLEHQQSGLIWGMDNWIYQTVNAFRLRYTGGKVEMEKTPSNGGQWGLTQDDYGRMFFSNAGGEKGPVSFQVPIIYGGFDVSGEMSPDFLEVWPLVGLADVQGGYSRFRPDNKTLNHITACAGQTIYRGDRLPADLRGDLLLNEPVGRLIRRAKVEDHEGMTYLKNAYDHSEFLRSTDPNFRPVNITTGPDGCIYIVDMYRGIIQEGNWVNAGSYLRKVVQQYGMQNNFGRGRIWRLVHDGFKPGPQPHMLNETPAQLVAHLDHPNGWWRDEAQKLIVLSGDKSVVPAVQAMARDDKNPLGRIHALWTLEGLDAVDASLLREKFKDSNAHVRVAAIRVAESLIKNGDTSLIADIKSLAKDPSPDVVLQTVLTAKLLNWPDAAKFEQLTVAVSPAQGVKLVGAAVLNAGREINLRPFDHLQAASIKRGAAIYQELCFACHGYTGEGMPMDGAGPGATQAPPLAGSPDVLTHADTMVHVLMNGLGGPVNDKTYIAQMVSMASNDDQWIADVTSYVRNAFGNHAAPITAAEVRRLRTLDQSRTGPWTLEELRAAQPQPAVPQSELKATASVHPEHAHFMLDGKPQTRWDTGGPLEPGQWVQVELPRVTPVGGLWADASHSISDYPRGYKVEVSIDGTHWKTVAHGNGLPGVLETTFAAVPARFVRLTQTGKLKPNEKTFWSIEELQVFGPASELFANTATK